MPTITLPDGKQLPFDGPVTGRQVAEKIGPRLAQDALAVKVDGEVRDLSTTITKDAKVSIITYRQRDKSVDADGLLLLRHSAAHIMAEAIQRVVPKAELVYGPPLATGFYYDIKFPEDRPLKEADFAAIEAEAKKIAAEDRPFTRYEMSGAPGLLKLQAEKNKYKVDNAVRALHAAGVMVAAGDDWAETGVSSDQLEK
ncbi:MAG: TGS domain-containing protein, partial [Phycisphaerales bacterium]|nr:TGS domain-containing protein [Phycisphaerales bacterium]